MEGEPAAQGTQARRGCFVGSLPEPNERPGRQVVPSVEPCQSCVSPPSGCRRSHAAANISCSGTVGSSRPNRVRTGAPGGTVGTAVRSHPSGKGPRPTPGAETAPAGNDPPIFQTAGDAVHYSSTPPPTISAHGWWLDKDSGGAKAKVTVELQIHSGGNWRTVATGSKTVKQGGGSSRRANARKTCVGTKATRWRSRVDVDIIGVADSPNRLETPAKTFNCGV